MDASGERKRRWRLNLRFTMAVWNDVSSGFDTEDETSNFGTRNVLENSEAVFETYTLATIRPQGKVVSNPHVIATSFSSGRVYIAVDQCLIAFKDESCTEILFKYTFNCIINAFTVSDDDSFIFVGVGNVVHCLHYAECCQLLFSRSVLSLECKFELEFIKIFIYERENHLHDILLVGNSGQIFRLPQINFELMLETVQKDKMLLKQITDILKVEVVKKECCKSQVTSVAALKDIEPMHFIFVGNEITVWSSGETEHESWMLEDPLPRIKTIKAVESASLIVGLTENSKLIFMCSRTLLCLTLWEEIPVQDFILLEGISAEDDTDALILAQPDENGETYIRLLSFPGLETKYQFRVSSLTSLVSLLATSQEILFLEGIRRTDSEFINALHVKNIAESQPEERFHRLLRRHKFVDAEAFAYRFNLDVELVHKKYARYLIQLLPSEENGNYSNFIHVLNKIKDLGFICEACMDALTIDLNKTQMLLAYASNRLKNSDLKNFDTSKISSLECRLWSTSLRLDTFLLAYQSDSEAIDWGTFACADLLSICKQHVEKGQLYQAALIWARHWSSLKNSLSEDSVLDLLNAVPRNSKIMDLMAWLHHFIPSVLSTTPQSIKDIVKWAIRSIKSMEVEKANWPRLGLNFAEQLLQVIKLQSDTCLEVRCNIYKQQSMVNMNIRELVEITSALKELEKLKENYKIQVTLADFMQDNKNEVVYILLGKIAPVDIESLLTSFLKSFMLNHGLMSDTVLSEYIQVILNNSANWWYYYTEAPWEPTVAAVIPCIQNIEMQIKCIISALKMAPVPWSTTINDMARCGLEMNHPLTASIRHEQRMMEVKMVQKKYGFTKLSLESLNLYDLIHPVQMIFKEDREGMLEDALKLATLSRETTDEIYILCIQHYLEIDKQQIAMALLDDFKPELIVKCCKRIIFKACSYLESKFRNEVHDRYLEVLHAVGMRLKKASYLLNVKLLSDDFPIEEMSNIYTLQMKFGKRVSLKDYSSALSRWKILCECIKELMISKDDIFGIYCKVKTLSSLLQFSPEEGALEIIHQALQSEELLLASELMRNFIHYDLISKSGNKKVLATVCEILQKSCTNFQIHGISQLTYSLLCTLCTQCTSDFLPSSLNILQWVNTVKYLTASYQGGDNFNTVAPDSRETMTTWHFTPLYRDPAIFSTGNEVLSFLKEVCRFCYNSQETLTDDYVSTQLQTALKKLQEQQCDLGAIRLWCSLLLWTILSSSHLPSQLPVLKMEKIGFHIALALLRKVITARKLDIELGLALLFFLGFDDANNWISESSEVYKQDFQKLYAVTQLGISYYRFFKLDNKHFIYIHRRCIWAKKLAKYGIPNTEVISTNSALSMHNNVLELLMHLKDVDMTLILEYCSDFELDLQECLLTYLRTVLLCWMPEYVVERTVDGVEELNLKNTDEVEEKCQHMIELIENKNELVKCLTSVFSELNYYNYEMHIYIITLLKQLVPSHNLINNKTLLFFLKKYKRVQEPKQEELEDWLQKFPESCTLPAISQWRLPFLPFMQNKIWNILTPELNLNNYKQWIKISQSFDIEIDNICSVAIKQTVSGRASSGFHATTDDWNLNSQNNTLLNQLEECVNYIARTSHLEMASACMYYVMNHTPPGADQVVAAKLCLEHTQKWAEQVGSSRAKERVMRVKVKYLCFATTHILHQYGLGISNYLKFTTKPIELMSALYQDPSIIASSKGHSLYCPDINSAVENLASLHKINFSKFCVNQLRMWLQPSGGLQLGFLDDTCDSTQFMQHPDRVFAEDDDNLLRACYILKCGQKHILAYYLVKLAFNAGSDEISSTAVQLRALQCLIATTPVETLEEITGKNIDCIGQMLKNLKYVCDLEVLGYSYSVSSFESCSKLELVKGIWKTQSNKPEALILMARLCIEFNVHQHIIWTSLLKQMTTYSMVRELEILLLHLADLSHLLSSTEYIQAWQLIVSTPFVKGEEDDACLHSLTLLQSCPILSNMNFDIIIENSLQMNKPHLAAVVLPFLKKEELNLQKQKILNSKDAEEIICNLKEVRSKGVLIAEKILLQEKGNEKSSSKYNAAIFIELESAYLIHSVADVELIFVTFKNVLQHSAKENEILLQGQCLLSMTTALLQAFEKINEDELSVLCTEHIEFLLSLVKQTNNANNCFLRSVAANCLTEMELCFPQILKDCLDNMYTAAVTEVSVAHQQYMSLLALIIKHSTSSEEKEDPLWGKYPSSQWKASFIPQECDTPNIGYQDLKEMVSFLVDQLPLCSTEGVAWIAMQIIDMMMQRADLQTSAQVLKPLVLHFSNTYSTLATHIVLQLEKQMGSSIFQEKDEIQLLHQLLLTSCHPSLSASIRLLYLDWLNNYLIRRPEKITSIQNVNIFFPNNFDGPETHIRKLKLLSSILKNKKGSSSVLLQALASLQKQIKCASSIKLKSVLMKVLYRYLCQHHNLEMTAEIPRLLVAVITEDVSFTPFVLNFVQCVQCTLSNSSVPPYLLKALVVALTQPDSTATLATFHFVLDVFLVAIAQDLSICQPKAILNYLMKYIVCEEVCGLLSWSLGHQILYLCYRLMCNYDTVEFFYELCEVLKIFVTNCEDVDLVDRAHIYHSLIVCLSNKKLKEVLASPKQSLTSIMVNESTFHSTSSICKLDEPILLLKKEMCAVHSKEQLDVEIAMDIPGDILKLHSRHLSFVAQKPLIIKGRLDTTSKFDVNLQPIQALAIFFTAPESWGRIEPIMIGHYTKDNSSCDSEEPYVVDIECFLYKPYPAVIKVCADFSIQSVCYMCQLEPLRLELPDLFQPLPVHDEFISSPVYWRKILFSNLYLSLEERSQTVNSAAFASVYVLQQVKGTVREKLKEKLWNYIVEECEDDIINVGIYLSPSSHLLLKFILREESALVRIATDDVHILAHVNNYFRTWR